MHGANSVRHRCSGCYSRCAIGCHFPISGRKEEGSLGQALSFQRIEEVVGRRGTGRPAAQRQPYARPGGARDARPGIHCRERCGWRAVRGARWCVLPARPASVGPCFVVWCDTDVAHAAGDAWPYCHPGQGGHMQMRRSRADSGRDDAFARDSSVGVASGTVSRAQVDTDCSSRACTVQQRSRLERFEAATISQRRLDAG